MQNNKKTRKVTLVVAICLLTIAIVLGLAQYFLTRSTIQVAFDPINNAMKQLGATSICRYNSDGDTFTGAKPYHYEYYSITDNPQLASQIKQKISETSFGNFKSNQDAISLVRDEIAQKNEFEGSDDLTKNSPGYSFSSANDYLISSTQEFDLRIIVHRNEAVSLQCMEGASYGQTRSASGTDVVVEIKLSTIQE